MIFRVTFSLVAGLVFLFQPPDIRADECSSYTNLGGDLTKRHPSNEYDPNSPVSDNTGFQTLWYRAGDLDMSINQPAVNSCGTEWPYYLSGSIPSDFNVHNLRACLGDAYDPCYHYKNVKVRNCGDYRVYELPSLGISNAAYCFEECNTCDITSTTTTTTTTTEDPEDDDDDDRHKKSKDSICFRPMEFALLILCCIIVCSIFPIAFLIRMRSTPPQVGLVQTVQTSDKKMIYVNEVEDIKKQAF